MEQMNAVSGVPEQIGYYLAGMEEVRSQLRDAVRDLSDEHANARFRDDAHTITELILHCGEAEWWWIQCVVNGMDVDEALHSKPFWDVS